MKIIAISDQHGHLPEIPPCDLLIVAGDQCPDIIGGVSARNAPDRQMRWFRKVWLPWREAQPAEACVATWGNHDFCGQLDKRPYVDERGNTIIAVDAEVEILGLRMWLTPWSNTFMKWAFMREPKALAERYALIPDGIDVIVSHQPPLGFGSICTYLDPRDGQMKTEHVGSVELLDAVQRVKPRAAICGHVHSGHGAYDCNGITVYNVSVVDEGYSLVHPPTEIALSASQIAV